MSPASNVVPFPSRTPRESVYDMTRMREAKNRTIPSLRVSEIPDPTDGAKDELHICLKSRGHYANVLVVGYTEEGFIGRCEECRKEIVGFMGRLKAGDLAYFTGESDIPPSWVG